MYLIYQVSSLGIEPGAFGPTTDLRLLLCNLQDIMHVQYNKELIILNSFGTIISLGTSNEE